MVEVLGLTNNPSDFIRLMNHVIKPSMKKYVVVYFDNNLVYRKFLEEHVLHLKSIFEVVRREKFHATLENSLFV